MARIRSFGGSGGTQNEYEYVGSVSLGTGSITVTIPTTKRAKSVILGGGYATNQPNILLAQDGDSTVYANGTAHSSLTATWSDSSVVISGTYSQYTAYTLAGYIIY